jgi:hypothetical protein
MSKNWMMLTALLFLGSLGTSQAHPLDSPDIVYIDGLPCNSACQSYMAWSRQQTSSIAQQSAPVKPERRSSYSTARHATAVHRESSKPAVHFHIAKQAVPLPPAKVVGLQPAGDATVASEPARANVAASPAAAGATATSNARTVQEQVAAATALAEHVTAASAAAVPEQHANDAEASGRSEAAQTEPTASAPTNNTDNRVALLMAHQEIKSVSDLTGRDVAIEDQQSGSSASIRTAIAAAGAAEVRFNEGHAKAIDRLIGGEVPAAVLALVSPEAAEWFPDIPGYKIFRIPLSPRSSKAGP